MSHPPASSGEPPSGRADLPSFFGPRRVPTIGGMVGAMTGDAQAKTRPGRFWGCDG